MATLHRAARICGALPERRRAVLIARQEGSLPPARLQNEVGYQRGTMIVSWPFFVTPFPNLAGYFRITRLSGPFSPKRRSGCSRMDCFMTIAAHHKRFAPSCYHLLDPFRFLFSPRLLEISEFANMVNLYFFF